MDRNQAIGLTLMALVLLIYFVWFAPQPEPLPPAADSLSLQQTPAAPAAEEPQASPVQDTLQVTPEIINIETPDLKIAFSTKGGTISRLELKNFKTYNRKPLVLVDPQRHAFELSAKTNGQTVNLYSLFYTAEKRMQGDSTVLLFTRKAGDAWLRFTYTIPPTGYEIGYALSHSNFLDNAPAELRWSGRLKLLERDLTDSRNYTTLVYRKNGDVDELPARSTAAEQETLTGNINWVSVKQKFFLNALISEKGFDRAVLQTNVNPDDTATIKWASYAVQIPAEQIGAGTVALKYYFGPNDYQTIGKVAPDFARNVYLGWPPVYWINKYVIFPVFHFLTKIFSNYGLIIIILVILLRLVLLPLSYRSYLFLNPNWTK